MKDKNKRILGGAICGGVISETQFKEALGKNLYGILMSFILPDVQYKKYLEMTKQGKEKEATKLFEKYAYSLIWWVKQLEVNKGDNG